MMDIKREDCFYYTEEMDMGAIIQSCALHKGIGKCHCNGCDMYISNADVFKDFIKERINENKA